MRRRGTPASRRVPRASLEPRALKAAAVAKAEELLGLSFTSKELLLRALTHRSWAHEQGLTEHNERLELLGDAVIGLVVTEDIFTRFQTLGEGALTQMKSVLVSRRLQARAARQLGLDACLLVGSSELKTGVTARVSTLANLFEAVVGALYLDAGLAAAKEFLNRTLLVDARGLASTELKDPKTALQELVQGSEPIHPQYHLVSVTGPDHSPTFTVEVLVRGEVIAQGSGPTKKEAERAAARAALARLADERPDVGSEAPPPSDPLGPAEAPG